LRSSGAIVKVSQSGSDVAFTLYSATTNPNPTTLATCGGTLSVTGAKLVGVGAETCPAGTAASTVGGVKSCVRCPVGKYCAAAAGTGDASTLATSCPAGTYSSLLGAASAGACTSCPAGTYSAAPGSVACAACGVGSFQDATGKSFCKECPGAATVMATTCNNECGTKQFRNPATGKCEVCPGGYGVDSSSGVPTCRLCPAGTQSPPDSAVCTSCAAGFYAPDESTETCSACPAGTSGGVAAVSCTQCPPGREARARSSTCTPCAAGHYRSEAGDAANALCVRCPGGFYTDAVTGATSCTKCPPGEGRRRRCLPACRERADRLFWPSASSSVPHRLKRPRLRRHVRRVA
jgi:hypothetical protein